jgi:hypothetical protein
LPLERRCVVAGCLSSGKVWGWGVRYSYFAAPLTLNCLARISFHNAHRG